MELQQGPKRKSRKPLVALLGGAGLSAVLLLSMCGDEQPPAPQETAAKPEQPATPVQKPAEKPRNPDAGKYMPLVLYADGKQNPYPGIINDDRMAEDKARTDCLKSDYAAACRPVATLTRDEPGCIAYARDTKDDVRYHMNIFHRVEDNKPFTTGNPTVPRYFCNDPILQRQVQDGVKVSPPKVVIDTTEVFKNEILVLTRNVYLANEQGKARGGPMIVEGSCVELHSGGPSNTGINAVAHLVTAWEKNGNGNNRSGYVAHEDTRSAIVGEYTPATCFAVFGPEAPN